MHNFVSFILSLLVLIPSIKTLTPAKNTELAWILQQSHREVFHSRASANRISMALAQIFLENGKGKEIYNYNLGNIGANLHSKPFHLISGFRYRSFSGFGEAAEAYWKTLSKCTAALQAFDSGDAEVAAQALKNCHYFQAELEVYSDGLNQLFQENYAFTR